MNGMRHLLYNLSNNNSFAADVGTVALLQIFYQCNNDESDNAPTINFTTTSWYWGYRNCLCCISQLTIDSTDHISLTGINLVKIFGFHIVQMIIQEQQPLVKIILLLEVRLKLLLDQQQLRQHIAYQFYLMTLMSLMTKL